MSRLGADGRRHEHVLRHVAEIMQRVYDNGWVRKGAYEGQDVGFAVDALEHLVQSGARPRAVAALTGTRADDLYKALTGREA